MAKHESKEKDVSDTCFDTFDEAVHHLGQHFKTHWAGAVRVARYNPLRPSDLIPEDLASQATLNFLNNSSGFRKGFRFSSFYNKTINNLIIDELRHRAVIKNKHFLLMLNMDSEVTDFSGHFKIVYKVAKDELSEPQLKVFKAYLKYGDKSAKEIASYIDMGYAAFRRHKRDLIEVLKTVIYKYVDSQLKKNDPCNQPHNGDDK